MMRAPPIKSCWRAGLVVSASLLTSACLMNPTYQVSPAHLRATTNRTLLILQLEDRMPGEGVSLVLDQYDLARQRIVGGCFFYPHVTARVAPDAGEPRLFAFEVPPGAYALSAFSQVEMPGPSRAFLIPEGRSTYLGRFLVKAPQPSHNRPGGAAPSAELIDDIAAAQASTGTALEPARTVEVSQPRPFLCTP